MLPLKKIKLCVCFSVVIISASRFRYFCQNLLFLQYFAKELVFQEKAGADPMDKVFIIIKKKQVEFEFESRNVLQVNYNLRVQYLHVIAAVKH